LQSALDKLDVIECFESPGQKPLVGEILEKQQKIYKVMDLPPLFGILRYQCSHMVPQSVEANTP
jgi:hypothetical protein